MSKIVSALLVLLCLSACFKHQDIEPKLNYSVQDHYLKQLHSPFPALTPEERATDWGREYTIGQGFARQLDLYQALTAYKRADILIAPNNEKRKNELTYDMLLCYYLGKKYNEVIYTFEHSPLRFADSSFPATHDLLVMLYDSYIQNDQENRAEKIFQHLQQLYPETAKKLELSTALTHADFSEIQELAKGPPPDAPLEQLLQQYDTQKKSVRTAKILNAILPGAGYLYVGQKQTALTSFLLNGLTIGAMVYFYKQGNIPAAAIFTSFEAGWYFGGIHGAGDEAKFYNERTYEHLATPMMNQNRLFPVLMLNYAF